MLMIMTVTVVGVVLLFDYTNGFHDAANIIATAIASRAMTPVQAVIVVGTFEFIGPLLAGTAVANTIGKFVDLGNLPPVMSLQTLLCGLLGAVAWNIITWWKGVPSSSSHALVGGLIGAVMVAVGADHVVWGFRELFLNFHLTGVTKVLMALILSPLIGFWAGYLIHLLVLGLLRGASPSVNRYLRKAQFLTSAGLAFAHGANDAQKSMGILTLALLLGGYIPSFHVPFWVVLACSGALALGIISGGWRIVRVLGFSIFKVRAVHALDSQITSAVVIFGSAMLGAPVSTTHVVASSIMGIGASERPRAVRWAKAGEIAKTWIITIPGAAIMGSVLFALQKGYFG